MIRRSLFWVSLILVFSVPWEDMLTLPVIGSLARLAGILLFGLWALKVILTGKVRKPHLFHVVLYFFIMWNLASLFWTAGFDETKTRAITFLQLLIMTIILWDIYRSPATLNAGLQAYVLGAWVGVIDMLINFASGVRIDAYEVGRYSASGVNAGDFVVILALGIPMAWYLARFAQSKSDNRILSYANNAYVPVSGAVIFLTGSRLALFTILPALIYVLATIIQPKKMLTSVVSLALIIGALLVFLTFIPQATWERLTTVKTSIAGGDLGGRVPIWRESITAFTEHPLLGVGSGAFRVVNPYKSAAHNTYLSVLAEVGLVGFLMFFALLVIAFFAILSLPQKELFFGLAIFSILTVGMLVQTWEFTKTTFLMLSFLVICANFAQKPASIGIETKARRAPKNSLRGVTP